MRTARLRYAPLPRAHPSERRLPLRSRGSHPVFQVVSLLATHSEAALFLARSELQARQDVVESRVNVEGRDRAQVTSRLDQAPSVSAYAQIAINSECAICTPLRRRAGQQSAAYRYEAGDSVATGSASWSRIIRAQIPAVAIRLSPTSLTHIG
ncbi:hypothetical protein B0H15DRAFT_860737 [Mycena belliarum]|uniref:Uncharacterized protein n=1 Tax=Mycena belliarum TaxID=1033014 RepID=A0AAD6XKU0_9AGAR|nr:hypothetical protein B0H15DRAFT_860737 [Mycena belliae]